MVGDFDSTRGDFMNWCEQHINTIAAPAVLPDLSYIRKNLDLPAWLRCLSSDVERNEIATIAEWLPKVSVKEISDIYTVFLSFYRNDDKLPHLEREECHELCMLTMILMQLEHAPLSVLEAQDSNFMLNKIRELDKLITHEIHWRNGSEGVKEPRYTFN